MLISKNEKGFSILEVLFVLAILALVGFAGWLVYKDHIKTMTINSTSISNNKSASNSTTLLKNTASSGIQGSIYNTDGCGNIPYGSSACTNQPSSYQATITVKNASNNHIVTTFSSSSDGSFTVKLDPGVYVLVPQAYNNNNTEATSQTVTVNTSTYTKITINYFTAIP